MSKKAALSEEGLKRHVELPKPRCANSKDIAIRLKVFDNLLISAVMGKVEMHSQATKDTPIETPASTPPMSPWKRHSMNSVANQGTALSRQIKHKRKKKYASRHVNTFRTHRAMMYRGYNLHTTLPPTRPRYCVKYHTLFFPPDGWA